MLVPHIAVWLPKTQQMCTQQRKKCSLSEINFPSSPGAVCGGISATANYIIDSVSQGQMCASLSSKSDCQRQNVQSWFSSADSFNALVLCPLLCVSARFNLSSVASIACHTAGRTLSPSQEGRRGNTDTLNLQEEECKDL